MLLPKTNKKPPEKYFLLQPLKQHYCKKPALGDHAYPMAGK
jgi:hypothetical protein